MGPPPFGDGKMRYGDTAEFPWGDASMGPPPFGDGKLIAAPDGEDGVSASMGPPPFGDGKPTTPAWPCPAVPCFNGATAFRRWKGVEVPIHVNDMEEASMGPPPFGDGKSF